MNTATSPIWFGAPERPQAGWLSVPVGREIRAAALVLPPVGYEYWSAHRTMRVLAERLAAVGYAALRVDYDGTGDSAGSPWDPDRVAAWQVTVAAGAQLLRRAGLERIAVVGARFGATLALLGAADSVDSVVAWNPVVSGRRYARELTLRGERVPDGTGPEPAHLYAGVVFTTSTLADIARVDATRLAAPRAGRLLLVDRPDDRCTRLADAAATMTAVEHVTLAGGETAFDTQAEEATVPESIVDTIVGWLDAATPDGCGNAPSTGMDLPGVVHFDTGSPGGGSATGTGVVPGGGEASMTWQRSRIVEQPVRIGPRGLTAIYGRPVDDRPTTMVVFLNSGSEPHVGPGRAWVDYCRSLNGRGFATMRVDFSGWGESPDLGHAPGRPYDLHGVTEAVEIVAAVRAWGIEHVVLAGLCAGAWIALAAAEIAEAAGVFAINPQLYWWPGDPVEVRLADTQARRAPDRRRDERGRRLGWWSFLDAIGVRHRAARRLATLRRRRIPVTLLFAEGDDGLEFLHMRCERAVRREQRRGALRVVEIDGIDHQMYREWLRWRVTDELCAFLGEFDEKPAPPAPRLVREEARS